MLQLEDLIGIAHEDDRDLLARDGQVRVKRRGGCAGDHTFGVSPAHRIDIPILLQIHKRIPAARLWLALKVVKNLHDLRARCRRLRRKPFTVNAPHEAVRVAIINAVIGPVVGHVRKLVSREQVGKMHLRIHQRLIPEFIKGNLIPVVLRTGIFHCLQIRAEKERAPFNRFQGKRKPYRLQCGTVQKGVLTNPFDSLRNNDRSQRCALEKVITFNLLYSTRDRYARKILTAVKQTIRQSRNTVRNRQLCQAREHKRAVSNCFQATRQLDRFQSVACGKCKITDLRYAVRKRDTLQIRAALHNSFFQYFDAVRNRQLLNTAAIKSITTNRFYAGGQFEFL